ncbi:hypothetical protein X551_04467 [Methylibium sp. T29]|nr:hypothetical protein X551_04467 [Methylibium sp. T29]
MREPVQQRGGHLRVAEDSGPFAEGQVGGDHHAGAFVQLAQQVEQQRSTGLAERQVAQLVQDDRVHAHEVRRNPPGLAFSLLPLQRIDQIDGRVEPHPLAVPRDAGHAQCRAQMSLARTRPADEHRVVRRFGERQIGQLVDQRAIDLGGLEVEARQVAVRGEASGTHLVAHRAHRPVGALGLQQVLDQPARAVNATATALGHEIGPGAGHAVQPQCLEFGGHVTHGAPPGPHPGRQGRAAGRSGRCRHAGPRSGAARSPLAPAAGSP